MRSYPLGTPNNVSKGSYFTGCIKLADNYTRRKAEDFEFKYVIDSQPIETSKRNDTNESKISPEDQFNSAVNDLKISWVSILKGKASEDLFNELLESNESDVNQMRLLLARMRALDSDSRRSQHLYRQICLANKVEEKSDDIRQALKDLQTKTSTVLEVLVLKGVAICDLIDEHKNNTPVTSDKDIPVPNKREYKGLVLRNGLKVLLISDVEADKSAASLSLNVGLMSDPREVQGLAHLLECMLFLGSRKYPGDNDYHKYISSNGGSCTTRTTYTYTAYLFDIATDYLPGALDRFAQFFIEPLFTESATEREINAINSEYESCITIGHFREDAVDRCLSDPDHDYSKFQIGNNESLKEIPYAKGIDVRQELLSFHKRWYSANIMSLVVLGKESIQELQELVIPMFSGIRNNSAIAPKWTTNPFSDPYLRKQCFIVPIDDIQSMKIMFPIPDMSAHYRSKPKWYLDNLIGHEGPGSLLSELRSRNWCTQLNTGCCCGRSPGFEFFCITVNLTEQGMDHTDDIIALVFQYINLLKREGPNESFHNELRQTHEIDFRFYEMWSNMYFTDYPIDECMSAKYTMDEFRPDLITDLLNHLTPDRMRVTV
ncbi:unnamed protein product, partial [Oppiella nova]